MLRSRADMQNACFDNCHDGQGRIAAHIVLDASDSNLGIRFMHDDVLEPGAGIGEHLHKGNEEVYFVVEGHGTMILDGQEHPFGPGDVSVVKSGHTHGLVNSAKGPMRLLVFCVE